MQKVKEFLKKSWMWLLLIPTGILGLVVLFWKNGKDWFKLMLDLRQSSQQESEDIRRIRERELEEQKKNKEKMDKILEQLRQRHEGEDKAFDDNKKKQVDELIKSCDNDPNKLAEQLSKVTGFKIILPPED